ncbi:MAG: acetate--CoA ligase family protein [Candidatus Bipolaricaulota bacterium]|nr:acetate--CoA ligase family protein [Candidatus Bipolaricaulota bacterium]MDW8126315.1 acetate--CoA ligase family protein [Candidatus Bipolaricaulota bacterium]
MRRKLDGLLFPRSVAVVGASATPGKVGHALFTNVLSFPGPVYAVNPKYRELLGRPCVPSISELPEPVDLAVIVIPAEAVTDALRQCGEKGIKNVVVISAGFKECGVEGAKREQELVRVAEEYDLNVLGPNVLGLISTKVGLNATFAPRGALPGQIAFLSQSGAFCTSVLDWAWKEKLGFSHFVSLGNKAVLNECDFLLAFAEDPETRVIVAYLEGIQDGPRFMAIAREVTREKPIVVLKAGRAEAGARAVSSHTGTMAGSDHAYDAAFRQCGVIRARTVEELFDFAYVLSRQPLPKGRRIGIVTNAGGAGVMAADAAEWEGLTVARLRDETLQALAQKVPEEAAIYNPVDVVGHATLEQYQAALELVLADPGVDLGVALSAPHPILRFVDLARVASQAQQRSGKPVAVSFMAGELGEEAEEILRRAGIPSFFDPARAVRALATLAKYAEIRQRPVFNLQELPGKRERVQKILAEARHKGRVRLGLEAADLLASYGIPFARGGVAKTAEEAKRIAQEINGPVAVKILSPELTHKTEVGGVRLGVPPEEVDRVAWELLTNVKGRFPEAIIDGVYVQEMLPPGREVILGMVRDPTFGPLLMFGLGGIYVEVLRDVAFAVAPLSRAEAEELVELIRGKKLLYGARGQPPVYVSGLVDLIVRVGQFAVENPDILELDLNPILCYPERVVAVDVRLTVAEEGT